MKSTVNLVENYIKHLNMGTVFTFSNVLSKAPGSNKDTVNHALKKMIRENRIMQVKSGVYSRPKITRFGSVPVSPATVVRVTAKEKNAVVLPSGVSVLNMYGLSEQLPMGYSYISSKRIVPFKVNNQHVNIRYSRAFENAAASVKCLSGKKKEKLLNFWIALEYMGKLEAAKQQKEICEIYDRFSDEEKNKLRNIFSGKLFWAKELLGLT